MGEETASMSLSEISEGMGQIKSRVEIGISDEGHEGGENKDADKVPPRTFATYI